MKSQAELAEDHKTQASLRLEGKSSQPFSSLGVRMTKFFFLFEGGWMGAIFCFAFEGSQMGKSWAKRNRMNPRSCSLFRNQFFFAQFPCFQPRSLVPHSASGLPTHTARHGEIFHRKKKSAPLEKWEGVEAWLDPNRGGCRPPPPTCPPPIRLPGFLDSLDYRGRAFPDSPSQVPGINRDLGRSTPKRSSHRQGLKN